VQHIVDAQVGVIASAVAAAAFVAIMLFGVEIPIVMYAADRRGTLPRQKQTLWRVQPAPIAYILVLG
jgi:hypothetical protein